MKQARTRSQSTGPDKKRLLCVEKLLGGATSKWKTKRLMVICAYIVIPMLVEESYVGKCPHIKNKTSPPKSIRTGSNICYLMPATSLAQRQRKEQQV